MKPFNIDLETVEGANLVAGMIEIEGAMTVRPVGNPLENVHQSRLSISLNNALALYSLLRTVLEDAQRRGMLQPPKS